MKYFIYILMLSIISCKSNISINNSKSSENENSEKLLLNLIVEEKNKTNGITRISYKNYPLIKVIDEESIQTDLLYKDKVIVKLDSSCGYLLESFNNEVLLISLSNFKENNYISYNTSFKRDEIYIFNDSIKPKKISLDGLSFIHLYPAKGLLGSQDGISYAIESIDFKKSTIELIDYSGNIMTLNLLDIELSSIPLLCDL